MEWLFPDQSGVRLSTVWLTPDMCHHFACVRQETRLPTKVWRRSITLVSGNLKPQKGGENMAPSSPHGLRHYVKNKTTNQPTLSLQLGFSERDKAALRFTQFLCPFSQTKFPRLHSSIMLHSPLVLDARILIIEDSEEENGRDKWCRDCTRVCDGATSSPRQKASMTDAVRQVLDGRQWRGGSTGG